VVVDDLDLKSIALAPLEANSPLIVDANAVLTGTVTVQTFQPVAWGNSEIRDVLSVVQHSQLPSSYFLNHARQSTGDLALPDLFRVTALEGSDHQK
jgi:hypothetical protein